MGGLFFRHRLVVEPSAPLTLSGYMSGLAADYPRPPKSRSGFPAIHPVFLDRETVSIYSQNMPTSKAQQNRVPVICKCGCGETFTPFPVYRPKAEGGGLKTPEYKPGHNPNCRKTQNVAGWNRGMKKGDHPSLERMGFQVGHEAFCDWTHVNVRLSTDPELRAKWLANKKGQVAWNTGKKKEEYSKPFPTGEDHGNWCGGRRGFRDTSEYRLLRLEILKRDNYTCQECGDRNHEGRGSRITLHVDHILPVATHPDLGMEPSNLRVLCYKCHIKTDTFGTKVLSFRKRLQPNQAAIR